MCHAFPQTSLVINQQVVKGIHCLHDDKWVPIREGESVVLRFVVIPQAVPDAEKTIPFF